ncbi:MAG: TetR/AcrR family transcriptional regulator [Bauldia sp.]|nr:TetR/AcrR family transcriptional regulator [Bauldia sp.]
MGARRQEHTRDELEALVVDAAEAIAGREGLGGVTMRRLAAAIGYAPNSIYHAVGDMDAIVLRLNARTLDRMTRSLKRRLAEAGDGAAAVDALVEGYMAFVHRNAGLWSGIVDYARPDKGPLPAWYEAALARPLALVDGALAPFFPDADDRRRSTAVLWAGLHGIASLAVSGKLGVVTGDDALPLARLLVHRYLAGREAA